MFRKEWIRHCLAFFRLGLFGLSLLLLCQSCASKRLWLNTEGDPVSELTAGVPVYTIYAVGDAGLDNSQSRAVIHHLAALALQDTHPGMVIFLGDNVYPSGLAPPSDSIAHAYGRQVLGFQTEALQDYTGPVIFIPGNHDWKESKAGGLEAVKRQAQFIKDLNQSNFSFLPANGCAGPELLQLNEGIVMIILDSQWWIQDGFDEPGLNTGCPFVSRDELVAEVHRLIKTHADKQIIMAFHHPLMTRGHHGGYFTVRDHIFPLTKVVKWLWLPLPVIGSIYPWYRSVIGHPQDLQHPRYKSLRDQLLGQLDYDGHMIFLSGHDHNMQYLVSGNHHFLLSGGGAKLNHVANGRDLVYGHRAAGFMQLDFFADGATQLTVYEVDPKTQASQTVLRKVIIER